jgi:Mu transposase, C-terminal domain
VVRACLYDPDVNTTYLAFAKHRGFTPLPTRPRNPKENGKQERSGGYVKGNALKGRRFESLAELNQFLRRWNRTIARLRIHGTTRKQVWSHFLETDQPALQSLPSERFSFFHCGTRGVHPDAHVEVEGAFYPVPTNLIHKDVQVRWDQRFVRVYYHDELVASHLRVAAGLFAPEPGRPPVTSSQKAYIAKLLGRCERVGPSLRAWADAAYQERGVRALRLMQGVLSLTRKHPREAILWAAERARERELFRYQDFRRLLERAYPSRNNERERDGQRQLPLLAEHPDIRPMEHYRLED